MAGHSKRVSEIDVQPLWKVVEIWKLKRDKCDKSMWNWEIKPTPHDWDGQSVSQREGHRGGLYKVIDEPACDRVEPSRDDAKWEETQPSRLVLCSRVGN